ncbi:MAG: F-box protein [Parachlamydiaceae bacterium]|nr:F-box protein [Parachlamydiaceae bacterium]
MNSLSYDIVHYMFEYLPPDDLVLTGATCKKFYKIAQDENLPARLLIPKLDSKIIQKNALILWNYPDGNFTVDYEGRLEIIRPHNLMNRFFSWYDLETPKKVNLAVKITFQEIYRLNQQGNIFFKPKLKRAPRRIYVWDINMYFSFYHPADYLGDKILSSEKFKLVPEICKAALLVKGQANLYEKIKRRSFGNYDAVADDRIVWTCNLCEKALFG